MRLMTSLAAASGDNGTLGDWARENGIGGVVVIVVGAIVLVGLLSGLAKIGKKNK